MKYAKVLSVLLAAGTVFLPSCGAEEEEVPEETPEMVGVYSYRDADSQVEWDKPGFTLFEDGTFTFHFSAISSYYGYGTYEMSGDTLILTTNDGNYEYRFTADGDAYVFDGENSSDVTHFADMPDGARFE